MELVFSEVAATVAPAGSPGTEVRAPLGARPGGAHRARRRPGRDDDRASRGGLHVVGGQPRGRRRAAAQRRGRAARRGRDRTAAHVPPRLPVVVPLGGGGAGPAPRPVAAGRLPVRPGRLPRRCAAACPRARCARSGARRWPTRRPGGRAVVLGLRRRGPPRRDVPAAAQGRRRRSSCRSRPSSAAPSSGLGRSGRCTASRGAADQRCTACRSCWRGGRRGWAAPAARARGAPFQVGWCSWYHYFDAVTEDDLRRQPGPVPPTGRSTSSSSTTATRPPSATGGTPTTRSPRAWTSLAADIPADGRQPGLWLAPFLVAPDSEVARATPTGSPALRSRRRAGPRRDG